MIKKSIPKEKRLKILKDMNLKYKKEDLKQNKNYARYRQQEPK